MQDLPYWFLLCCRVCSAKRLTTLNNLLLQREAASRQWVPGTRLSLWITGGMQNDHYSMIIPFASVGSTSSSDFMSIDLWFC